ncbi:hypothetical protein PoB_001563600 [Plakobranchus ocellatus]|uniref:Uncharacterized protein n=1 Tax=Plakobranchus ocellatus TaxID=259542 RepID=A0AAV3Z001_9GAST|nr:hypothetical protein PoB_001563600 [Plakobranchus ocellatus]
MIKQLEFFSSSKLQSQYCPRLSRLGKTLAVTGKEHFLDCFYLLEVEKLARPRAFKSRKCNAFRPTFVIAQDDQKKNKDEEVDDGDDDDRDDDTEEKGGRERRGSVSSLSVFPESHHHLSSNGQSCSLHVTFSNKTNKVGREEEE